MTVTVTVVDHAEDGFNFSEEAMNFLTCVLFLEDTQGLFAFFADAYNSNGQAGPLGAVDATAVQVDKSRCGL